MIWSPCALICTYKVWSAVLLVINLFSFACLFSLHVYAIFVFPLAMYWLETFHVSKFKVHIMYLNIMKSFTVIYSVLFSLLVSLLVSMLEYPVFSWQYTFAFGKFQKSSYQMYIALQSKLEKCNNQHTRVACGINGLFISKKWVRDIYHSHNEWYQDGGRLGW